jgi:hypothetical protein
MPGPVQTSVLRRRDEPARPVRFIEQPVILTVHRPEHLRSRGNMQIEMTSLETMDAHMVRTLARGRTPMRRLRSRQRIPGVDRGRPQSWRLPIADLVGQLEPVWPAHTSSEACSSWRPPWKRAQSSSAGTLITRTTSGGPAHSVLQDATGMSFSRRSASRCHSSWGRRFLCRLNPAVSSPALSMR